MGDIFIGGYQPKERTDKPYPPKEYKSGCSLTDEEREQIIEELNKHSSDIMAIEPRYEDRGRVELEWFVGSNVDDFINILLTNGYKVSVRLKEEQSGKVSLGKTPLGKEPENIAVIEFERVER